MKQIEQLITLAQERNASDIHIVTGAPIKFRIDGSLENESEEICTKEQCIAYAKELANDQYSKIEHMGELDLASTIQNRRVRMNIFHQQGSISISLRVLADTIPELKDLGLPPIVQEFARYNKGIILVTGETGSGKSTTLAALLDQINHSRKQHIITLEDPIEYIYQPDLCLINQREIGTDTESYNSGLKAILREDPDIILIGEMRDSSTIETALTAAETGHLVFATLHTNSAVDSIDRIVGTFPAEKQGQIRLQLSTTLKAVLSQQLLVRKQGKGRVAACEVMVTTPAIRNMIRDGKTPQMQSALLASTNLGAISMDNCLIKMVKEGLISGTTAVEAANDSEYVKKNGMVRM